MTERLVAPPRPVSGRGPVSGDGVLSTAEEFRWWWAERQRAGRFEVSRIPFAELDAWTFDERTGNLGHRSGRFFTVEGVQVEVEGKPRSSQPIINQPEIGVLGIVVRDIDGVLHALMQAKMEPGNVNTLQLSPTVQATRSNYTQVHRGLRPRYLEHFGGSGRGEVLVDVLQSEQGAWFWRKRNRNIVVRVRDELPLTEDHRWLPLPLVHELLAEDNLVNMDARTVLSCVPFSLAARSAPAEPTGFADQLHRSFTHGGGPGADPGHGLGEILSWFIEAKTRCDWSTRLVPLSAVRGWRRTVDEIGDDDGRGFRIIAVRVRAGNREVQQWTQPLLDPRGEGRVAFVARPIDGLLHLLVRARPEIGLLDLVEMGATIQVAAGSPPTDLGHPALADVLAGRIGRAHIDVRLSEEGGRFHRAINRYQLIEVDEEFPLDVPEDFCWVTLRQLTTLLRHGHYLNIEARSLLACARTLAAGGRRPEVRSDAGA